jgi:predicted nucleic acid-binding protein
VVSFDTNVLVYATASISDVRVMRARAPALCGLHGASCCSRPLQNSAAWRFAKREYQSKDIRKTIDAWCAVLPVQAADDSDLLAALEAVRAHRLAFWDAMLWASARRAGVKHLLTEDLQDGLALQCVTFINPFNRLH